MLGAARISARRGGLWFEARRRLHLHEYQSMEIMRRCGALTPEFAVARTGREAEAAAEGLRWRAAAAGGGASAAGGGPTAAGGAGGGSAAEAAAASNAQSDATGFAGGANADAAGTAAGAASAFVCDPDESASSMDFVVKAQVLAGGRGLGYFKENNFKGGVHVCTSPSAVRATAEKMLGRTLVTRQTGPEGKPCDTVLVAERFYIRRERYFAILLDRASGGPVLLGSAVGGTSIEDIAERHPESMVKCPVDVRMGLSDAAVADFAAKLLDGRSGGRRHQEVVRIIRALYHMFVAHDCLLVEVNPLAETHDGRILVCDAKVNFDDNAAFRQRDIFELRDEAQQDPREVIGQRNNLNYIGLDGSIGCMVNGAGLAMATMDLIHLNGGRAANFLDVGGGATGSQIVEALRLLQQDPRVDSILVNIFGGIMRCDIIALGLIQASQVVNLSKPLVVRLEGTNKAHAQELLDQSGLKISFESDLNEAARKAVKMAEIIKLAREAKLDVHFDM